ncbi:hypothetical protein D3C81_2041590 [compost metagenome]
MPGGQPPESALRTGYKRGLQVGLVIAQARREQCQVANPIMQCCPLRESLAETVVCQGRNQPPVGR